MVVKDQTENKPGIRVFVYGTLKRGRGNNYLLGDAEFLGRCTVVGKHRLVDLGYYPGLVSSNNPADSEVPVMGEVYRVSRETLDTLDMLEGHPDYYARTKVQTPWKGAWAYYLPSDYLTDTPLVPTADNSNVQVWRPTEEELEYVRTNYAASGGI